MMDKVRVSLAALGLRALPDTEDALQARYWALMDRCKDSTRRDRATRRVLRHAAECCRAEMAARAGARP